MRVAVWVAQLVGDSVQEQVATYTGAIIVCVLIYVIIVSIENSNSAESSAEQYSYYAV